MTLVKQNVPVVLGLGIDTSKDPKQMQGQLLVMENARMDKTGLIQKRDGYQSLGKAVLNGTNLTTGLKLATYNDELLLVDRRSLYSYGQESAKWGNKGSCPTASVSTINVVTNSYQQLNPDSCYSNNTTTYAWEDSRGGVRAIVIDQSSGSRVIQDVLLNANGIRPRCFAIGQFHFIYYYDTVNTRLVCRRLDIASPTAFSGENIISTAVKSSTPHFDVCLVGTSRMVVGYRNASDQLELAYVLSTGAVGGLANGVPAPKAITAEDPDTCIALIQGERALQQDTFHVVYYSSADGVKSVGFFGNFEVYLASTVIDADVTASVRNVTGIAYTSGLTGQSRLDLFWERSAAVDINFFIQRSNGTVASNTYSPVATFHRAAGLASKAYRSDEATRVMASYSSAEGFQDTYFSLSDGSSLAAEGWGFNWGNNWGGYAVIGNRSVIQAKILSTVAGGHTNKTSQLPGVWSIQGSEVTIASLRKTRVVADNTSVFTLKGINQVRIDHQASSIGVASQLGQNLHIPGGFLKMYDGESVTEHGFHIYPESVTSVQGATGDLADGTYQHTVIWEWIDSKGQIHRSAPSIPVSVTVTGGPKRVTLTIPTLRYTAKTAPGRSEVIASVYRTQAGGTIFYKVSSDTSPTYNDPTADTISYVDTLVDSAINSRPILYTTGETLENTPVSSCNVVVAFKNRLFAAGLENSSDILYSKEYVKDEGVAFSQALNVSANSGGGGIRALAVLDDKLVIFKETQIFILTGDGPTDTGEQNDFGPPQQVASDVGCVEPESVVLTSKGVMFKSAKGIYLLDRSLQPLYIGDRVQDYNDLDVSSAVVVPDVNQVRFTTTAGTTLVYDYYYDAWSTFTNQASVSAVAWLSSYVYLKADGSCLNEVRGYYADDATPIRTRLETSWVSTAGLQGYQRLYRIALLGSYEGQHTLKASVAYDFQEHYRESFTIKPSDTALGSVFGESSPFGSDATYGGSTGTYQFLIKPQVQKCQSFKLLIEDLFPEGEGTASFTISGVTAQIGVKAGLNKVSNARVMLR